MTKTDTSREAVERQLKGLEAAGHSPRIGTIPIMSALLTERDALQARAERAEAVRAAATEVVTLLWESMGKQEDVGPHGGYIYTKLRATLAQLDAEPHSDDLAVDRFAAAMKAKLAKKRKQGRSGWNDPEECTVEELSSMLRNHVVKGDPVDVGNLAMMLHQRGSGIVKSAPENGDCFDYRDSVAQKVKPALEPGQTHREGWEQCKEAAAAWHDECAKHDADGLEYSNLVGIPISNAAELRESVEFHEYSANAIRAMPYPGDSQ